MSRTTITTSRFGMLLAVVALALAVVMPAAASPRPDDRAGAIGVGAVLSEQSQAAARPDDRADRRVTPVGAPTASSTSSSDFGWGDVAGISFFLGAVGVGTLSLLYTRRRLQSA
jgi:hypothetical protein